MSRKRREKNLRQNLNSFYLGNQETDWEELSTFEKSVQKDRRFKIKDEEEG